MRKKIKGRYLFLVLSRVCVAGDVVVGPKPKPELGLPEALEFVRQDARLNAYKQGIRAVGETAGDLAASAVELAKARVEKRKGQIGHLWGRVTGQPEPVVQPKPNPSLSSFSPAERAAIEMVEKGGELHVHSASAGIHPAAPVNDEQLLASAEQRIQILLSDKGNYGKRHLDNLLKEVNRLLMIVQKLQERSEQYPSGQGIGDMNVGLLQQAVACLKDLDSASKIAARHEGLEHHFQTIEMRRELGAALFFKIPQQPVLQSVLQQRAFTLYKRIFSVGLKAGSAEEKAFNSFISAYQLYLKDPTPTNLQAAQNIFDGKHEPWVHSKPGVLAGPGMSPHPEGGYTFNPLPQPPTDAQALATLQELSTAVAHNSSPDQLEQLAKRLVLYDGYAAIDHALKTTTVSLSLDKTPLFAKGLSSAGSTVPTFNSAFGKLGDTVYELENLGKAWGDQEVAIFKADEQLGSKKQGPDSVKLSSLPGFVGAAAPDSRVLATRRAGYEAQIPAQLADLAAVTDACINSVEPLFEKAGVADVMKPLVDSFRAAVKQVTAEAQQQVIQDPLQAAQTMISGIMGARSAFEAAYRSKMADPSTQAAVKRFQLQQVLDAQIAALKEKSAPPVEPTRSLPSKGSDTSPSDDDERRAAQEEAIQAIEDKMEPLVEVAREVQDQVATLQALMKKEPFDEQTLDRVLALYDQLHADAEGVPLSYSQTLSDVAQRYEGLKQAQMLVDAYRSILNETTFALTSYSSLIVSLRAIRDTFDEAKRSIKTAGTGASAVPFFPSTGEALARYTRFTAQGFDGITKFVDTKAQELLEESKELGFEVKQPRISEPTKPAPRPIPPSITQAQVEKAAEDLGDAENLIGLVDLDRDVGDIRDDLRTAQQLHELQPIYVAYQAFQRKSQDLDDLTREVEQVWPGDVFSAGDFTQTISEQIQKKQQLLDKLRQLKAQHQRLLDELKGLRLEDVPFLIEFFTKTSDLIAGTPPIESLPEQPRGVVGSLKDYLTGSSQPLTPSADISQLGKLLFWKSSSSEFQAFIRSGAESRLRAAFKAAPRRYPQAQVMFDSYGELALLSKSVAQFITDWHPDKPTDASQLISELEHLRAKVRTLPDAFKDPFLNELRVMEGKLKSSQISTQDMQDQFANWTHKLPQQLVDSISSEDALQDLRRDTKSMLQQIDTNLTLLAQHPLERGSDPQFSQTMNDLERERKTIATFMQNSSVWHALQSIGDAESQMAHAGTVKSMLGAAGKMGLVSQDAAGQITFDRSEKNLIDLLVFKEPTFVGVQEAVRSRALADLEKALTVEELLTPKQKEYDTMVVNDYKQFTALVAASRQAVESGTVEDLEQARQNIADFMGVVATADAPATGMIARYLPSLDLPSYVEIYRTHVLDELRAEQAEINQRIRDLSVPPKQVEGSVDEHERTPSETGTNDTFHTGEEGAEGQGGEQFEPPLSQEDRDALQQARKSFAIIRATAAKLAAHPKSVDSIGLAEQLLTALTTYEQALLPRIVESSSDLQADIADLKITLGYVINRQKMAVVDALTGAYQTMSGNGAATDYPPLTATFADQARQIMTPHDASNVKGSSFGTFLASAQALINEPQPTSEPFVSLVKQERDALVQAAQDKQYEQEMARIKAENASVKDAFAQHQGDEVQGAVAAVQKEIGHLEADVKAALPNPRSLAEQAQDIKERVEAYLLAIYRNVDPNQITSAQLDRYKAEVHGYRALCEQFFDQLRQAQSVNQAFAAYDKVASLYAKLADIESVFDLVRRNQVRDTTSVWQQLAFYFSPDYHSVSYLSDLYSYDSPDMNERFLADPVAYVSKQVRPAEQALARLGARQKVAELEQEAQQLLDKVRTKKLTARDVELGLNLLQDRAKPLRLASDAAEEIYDTCNVLVTSNPAKGKEALSAFEVDAQGTRLPQHLVMERIARMLSIPGDVYIPPSRILAVDRVVLYKRLIDTGKTKDQSNSEGERIGVADPRYRDLVFVLKNPLCWDYERAKLEGRVPRIGSKGYRKLEQTFQQMQDSYVREFQVAPALQNFDRLLEQVKAAATAAA